MSGDTRKRLEDALVFCVLIPAWILISYAGFVREAITGKKEVR